MTKPTAMVGSGRGGDAACVGRCFAGCGPDTINVTGESSCQAVCLFGYSASGWRCVTCHNKWTHINSFMLSICTRNFPNGRFSFVRIVLPPSIISIHRQRLCFHSLLHFNAASLCVCLCKLFTVGYMEEVNVFMKSSSSQQ